MKLVKVKIFGFGKWVDQEFEINPDYQVIFGKNEAGKTTFLTFVKRVLFGFASGRGNEKYEQYKPKNSTSYGGQLEFVDDNNSHWTVQRLDGKGDGELSLYKDDQEVPNTLITEITHGFNLDDFEATHVLNDQTVRSVYDLDEQTLETEILALGAAGSKEWLKTSDQLEDDSSDIYRPRGVKQPLALSIKNYQKLIEEKAQSENQQQKYLQIKQELDSTSQKVSQLTQEQKQLQQDKTYWQNLLSKLPKYQDYSKLKQLNLSSETNISNDDWENYLQLRQQISTLKESHHQQEVNHISDEEQAILDNYLSNQADIDYISSRKDEIQNTIFQNKNYDEQLKKNNYEIDQLKASNPGLDGQMQLLSDAEISFLQKPELKPNYAVSIAVALISILLMFFVPTALKVILAIALIAAIGYAGYQYKLVSDQSTKQQSDAKTILLDKNYQEVSPEQAVQLQPVIRQLQQLEAEKDSSQAQLQQTSDTIGKWLKLLVQVHILQSTLDTSELIATVNQYYDRLNQIQTKATLIKQDEQRRANVLKSNNQSLDNLQQQMNGLFNKYQVSEEQDFADLHQKQLSEAKQIQQLQADKDYLGTDLEEFAKVEDLSQINDNYQSANQKLAAVSTEYSQLLTQQGSLDNQMKQVFDDSAYQKLIDDITQAKADMLEQYDEWLSDKLASKWIHEMLNLASENRYPKMIERAKKYFSTLTNGNYLDINMSKQKKLSLVRKDKTTFDVHELSKATRVQLYISLRLAFVVEISDLVKLPILIDDAFVDFDADRSQSVFELIKQVSEDNQVIFVTANMNQYLPNDHLLSI